MDLERRVAFAQNKRDVVLHTEDAKEGVEAFAQKRAPVWKGR
jgi:enoyl-CoA hydratase/carnithine racemase